jgi:hypothetical protein
MSAALCLACGNVKQGAFVPCRHCGNLPEDSDLSIALTDHYLDITTLEDFGRVIKQLRSIAPDEETAMMSFLQLMNVRHPEIALTIATPSLEDRAKAVVYLSAIPEIRITDSLRANSVSADPVERLTASRVAHHEVECRDCGHTQSFAAWQNINVTRSELAGVLLETGQLFGSTCRKCGDVREIAYETVYLDFTDAVAIWLKPERQDIPLPAVDVPDAELIVQADSRFRLRKVRTLSEFAEKLRIFGDGWDDAVIELKKLQLCFTQSIPIETPPLYDRTQVESDQREVTFEAEMLGTSTSAEIKAMTDPVIGKLKSGGYLNNGQWAEVSTSSMLRMLEDAGMLRRIKPPEK